MTTLLSGWGRTAPTAARRQDVRSPEDVRRLLAHPPAGGVAFRGLGRSYNDASQNAGGIVADCTALRGGIDLDEARGVVTATGGTTIEELLRTLVPRGFFVPVTPGTRHVTVGGAVASDVHGKNHHADGTFGAAVESLVLDTPAFGPMTITPGTHHDLFWTTVGGMGLTGAILQASFRVPRIGSNRMAVETRRSVDLDECMQLLVEAEAANRYTVAWVDLLAKGRHLGRSVVDVGNHADANETADEDAELAYAPRELLGAPPWAPSMLLNPLTIRVFNELWYRKAPRTPRRHRTGIDPFFYPLDAIRGWNRLYGRRGFVQHQCVIPTGQEPALRRVLERFAGSGTASFLVVLKRFGPRNPGFLSFPVEGWTLAVDVPGGSSGLRELLDEIDRMVVEAGGRLYLAKDARMRPELLAEMYPELDRWKETRRSVDPDGVLRTDLSRRLGLDG